MVLGSTTISGVLLLLFNSSSLFTFWVALTSAIFLVSAFAAAISYLAFSLAAGILLGILIYGYFKPLAFLTATGIITATVGLIIVCNVGDLLRVDYFLTTSSFILGAYLIA